MTSSLEIEYSVDAISAIDEDDISPIEEVRLTVSNVEYTTLPLPLGATPGYHDFHPGGLTPCGKVPGETATNHKV
ncbi:hypothetical protein CRYUN_Cryun35bG0047100 [Craigia yunnanensis]